MLDLDSLTGQKKKNELTAAATTLFYQTDECREQLEEAMKYEGMSVPYCQACTDEVIADAIVGVESTLILVEVKHNLVDLAHLLHPLVSPATRVVLIGREDSITALRAIKHLGFYISTGPPKKWISPPFCMICRKTCAVRKHH